MELALECHDRERPARCLVCGKALNAEVLQADRVDNVSSGACIVTCTRCETENELEAQPIGSLDHKPEIVVTGAKTA